MESKTSLFFLFVAQFVMAHATQARSCRWLFHGCLATASNGKGHSGVVFFFSRGRAGYKGTTLKTTRLLFRLFFRDFKTLFSPQNFGNVMRKFRKCIFFVKC